MRSLLRLFTLLILSQSASALTVIWNKNPETNVVGYRVYSGTASRQYSTFQQVLWNPNSESSSVSTFIPSPSVVTYFAVTAFDDDGLESGYSAEAIWTPGSYVYFVQLETPKFVTITNLVPTIPDTNHIQGYTVTVEILEEFPVGTTTRLTVNVPRGASMNFYRAWASPTNFSPTPYTNFAAVAPAKKLTAPPSPVKSATTTNSVSKVKNSKPKNQKGGELLIRP